MSVETKINWADSTASPWHGCNEAVYIDANGIVQYHPVVRIVGQRMVPRAIRASSAYGATRLKAVGGSWMPTSTENVGA